MVPSGKREEACESELDKWVREKLEFAFPPDDRPDFTTIREKLRTAEGLTELDESSDPRLRNLATYYRLIWHCVHWHIPGVRR